MASCRKGLVSQGVRGGGVICQLVLRVPSLGNSSCDFGTIQL